MPTPKSRIPLLFCVTVLFTRCGGDPDNPDTADTTVGETTSNDGGAVTTGDEFRCSSTPQLAVTWKTRWGDGIDVSSRDIVSDGTGSVYAGSLILEYLNPGLGYSPQVTKISTADGAIAWQKEWGTWEPDEKVGGGNLLHGLTLGPDGKLLVIGDTRGSVGISGEPPNGLIDAFVSQIDPKGNVEWTVQWGDDGYDYYNAIKVVDGGSMFVGGGIGGNTERAAITHLSGAGEPQWTTIWELDRFTDVDESYSFSWFDDIAIAPDGSVYGTGSVITMNSNDPFVAHVSPDGEIEWTLQLPGPDIELFEGIEIAANGDLVVAGWREGLTSDQESLVARVSPGGKLLWSERWGGDTLSNASDLLVLNSGCILVSGAARGDLDGPTDDGSSEPFVAGLTSDGKLLWVTAWASTDNGAIIRMTPGTNGEIYVVGTASSEDLGDDETDVFVARLD